MVVGKMSWVTGKKSWVVGKISWVVGISFASNEVAPKTSRSRSPLWAPARS